MTGCSLTKIYVDLGRSWTSQSEIRKEKNIKEALLETRQAIHNRFVTLEDVTEKDDDLDDHRASPTCRECEETTLKATSRISSTPQLSDDSLSDAFEIQSQLQVLMTKSLCNSD